MAATTRTRITLACTECKQRNYDNMKNKKNNPDRIELKNIASSAKSTPFIRRRNNHGERQERAG